MLRRAKWDWAADHQQEYPRGRIVVAKGCPHGGKFYFAFVLWRIARKRYPNPVGAVNSAIDERWTIEEPDALDFLGDLEEGRWAP